MLFPLGFSWLSAPSFDGLVVDTVTAGYFNGAVLNGRNYTSPFQYAPTAAAYNRTNCTVSANNDYTTPFANYLTNQACPAPQSDLSLIQHLVDMVSVLKQCFPISYIPLFADWISCWLL